MSQPNNKLSSAEREEGLSICNSEEFRNNPPAQIVNELLGRGTYVASESTIYRVLHKKIPMTHRLNSQEPRKVAKSEALVTTGVNQVWT